MVKYYYRDNLYSIVPCTKKDIPSHTERVLSYWKRTGTNLEKQREFLELCVDSHKSFKIIKNDKDTIGCMYCSPINKTVYNVIFTWFKNGIVLGLGLDYLYHFTPMQIAVFSPHQHTRASYKSILSKFNILCYYNSNKPIEVNIKNIKLMKLYNRYYLSKGIKRVTNHE